MLELLTEISIEKRFYNCYIIDVMLLPLDEQVLTLLNAHVWSQFILFNHLYVVDRESKSCAQSISHVF